MPASQGTLFMVMVGCGLIMGILYDVFRILRLALRMGRFFTALMDLVYWLIVTAFALFAILFFASGELRGYQLLGMALGGILHLGIISPLVMKLIRALGRLIPQEFWNKLRK